MSTRSNGCAQKGLDHLAGKPILCGDRKVDDSSAIKTQYDQGVEQVERRRGDHEHVNRRRIRAEIRDLIRRMSNANPLWGAPHIHGELLKLGIEISQAAVGRWMPWRPKAPSPTWRSFLRNHLPDITAIDMFVVTTATFRLLYALIVLSVDRRRVVHFAVTSNPTQDWLSGQMTEAFPWDTAPRYLQRDRDKSYGPAFRHRVRAMGITEVITAPRSPWQNPYAERLIGSIRQNVSIT